jgi:hypothetical protein
MAKGNAFGRVGSPDRWKQDKVSVKLVLNRFKSKDSQIIDFFNNVPKTMVAEIMREFLYLGFKQAVGKDARSGVNSLRRAIEMISQNIEDDMVEETSNLQQPTSNLSIQQSQQPEQRNQPVNVPNTKAPDDNQVNVQSGLSFLNRGAIANPDEYQGEVEPETVERKPKKVIQF